MNLNPKNVIAEKATRKNNDIFIAHLKHRKLYWSMSKWDFINQFRFLGKLFNLFFKFLKFIGFLLLTILLFFICWISYLFYYSIKRSF